MFDVRNINMNQLMLFVVDLSQDCGSIVLHASFDADPLTPVSSCLVSIVYCVCFVVARLTSLVWWQFSVLPWHRFVFSS